VPDQDGPPAFGTSQTAGIAAMRKSMSTLNGLIILSLYLPCFVAIAATTLRIENTTGNIYVEVVMGSTGVTMSASSPNRAIRSGDAEYSNFPERLLLVAHSSETDPVNLKVSVPHTVQLEVVTTTGSITLTGLLPTVNLMTHSGDIKLVAPWRFTRLHLRSE
jgi:hypothetical protein